MKLIQVLSALLITTLLFSCNPYRKITFTNSQFYKKKRVTKNIDRYDVVIHDDKSTYLLEDAQISNDTITGELEPIELDNDDQLDEEEKDDIHIYLGDKSSEELIAEGDQITISESDVEKAEMFAKDDDGIMGVFLTVVLIVLAIIVGTVLILLLAIASAGSGSGGSDSGGSDSGGSNSGGSNSSCYIATMTYGSYDAPQVLILRKFRDRFLQKFGLGRMFIKWYYANSPSFVEKHKSKTWIHSSLRVFLNGLVIVLKPFYKK